MGLNSADLKAKIKQNYESYTHEVKVFTPVDENGTEVTDPSDPEGPIVASMEESSTLENLSLESNSDLDYLVTAIADAIISEIKAEGIDIGPSTADSLDVG